MRNITIIFLVLISILTACNRRAVDLPVVETLKEKIYALEPNDSANYKHIKDDFYLSEEGNLCERKLVPTFDSTCNCEFQVFYDSLMKEYTDDSVIKRPLQSIVDINSFVWLEFTEYSKDKNNVYYFYGNSDGGTRAIVGSADPGSFKRLCEYRWGIDKSHVFYKTQIVEGIDVRRVDVLYPTDTSSNFVSYVKDDKNVFFEDNLVFGADAKTFKVVIGKGWDAEDKNYKYNDGQRKK